MPTSIVLEHRMMYMHCNKGCYSEMQSSDDYTNEKMLHTRAVCSGVENEVSSIWNGGSARNGIKFRHSSFQCVKLVIVSIDYKEKEH